jgi:Electron transfer DM13
MKKYIKKSTLVILSVTTLIISSCSNDTNATNNPVEEVAYLGTFTSSAHPTTGNATVNTAKTILNFSNFMSDNGPDLNIYLASDISNIKADYIDLGDIKGLNGNFNYTLPTGVDISKYKHVVVWCVDFDVNFGYATLTMK